MYTSPGTPDARLEQIGSLFDDLFVEVWQRPSWLPTHDLARRLPAVSGGRVDVVDQGTSFLLVVDLPGVRPEDVSVSISGASVTIASGPIAATPVGPGDRVLLAERRARRFHREIELPAAVVETGADVRSENGVLSLTLRRRLAAVPAPAPAD